MTGVQTCALPIFLFSEFLVNIAVGSIVDTKILCVALTLAVVFEGYKVVMKGCLTDIVSVIVGALLLVRLLSQYIAIDIDICLVGFLQPHRLPFLSTWERLLSACGTTNQIAHVSWLW